MRKRVLIVAKDDSLRFVLSNFLSKQFEAWAVQSDLAAMACLHQGFLPDLIVTDKGSSAVEGLQFLSDLSCSGMFCSIPVIVLGKPENEEEEQHFRQSGALDYFRKPFSPVKLQNRISQLVS